MAPIKGNNGKNSKKIDEVKEVIQNKPDADIIKLLELFDNDVAKTINAFMSDGGKEALAKWTQAKKQEKKAQVVDTNENGETVKDSTKKSNKKGNNGPNKVNAPNKIDDLVSSIINQSISTTVPSSIEPNQFSSSMKIESNDTSLSAQIAQQQNILNNLNNLIIGGQSTSSKGVNNGLKVTVLGIEQPGSKQQQQQSSVTSSPSSMSSTSTFDPNPKQQRTQLTNQVPTTMPTISKSKTEGNHPLNSHVNLSYTNPNNTRNVVDKSQKDLQRQSTQLTRISSQFQAELNKSQQTCNQTFMLLRNLLDQRQAQLQANLNQAARQASQTLSTRQHKAQQLKNLADNFFHLNDQDTLELKADIKHFVSERLLDEEFGKIKIFQEDNYDELYSAINNYGHVAQLNHIKYATVRPPTEELLNNSFSAPAPVVPQPQREAKKTAKTNGKQMNSNSNGNNNNINHSTAQSAVTKPTNGKFSVKIQDVSASDDEGEFIEVKKQQRNKNKPTNTANTVVTNGNHNENSTANKNVVNKKNVNGAPAQTTTTTNGNSNGQAAKKQRKKAAAAANAALPKANQNPFTLIANGQIN